MTRLTIEIAAEDDRAAAHILEQLAGMTAQSIKATESPNMEPRLAPGYSTGDIIGSSVCTVTREPDPPLPGTHVMTPEEYERITTRRETLCPDLIGHRPRHYQGRPIVIRTPEARP